VKSENKNWRSDNPEKVKESNKNWRSDNKEIIRKYDKKYRNTEKRKKYLNQWYSINSEYNKKYYENNKEQIFTEDLKINPRLWYSLSKKMAEEVCESYRINYDMKITTLRFFNVFGPRQDIHRKNPPLLNYLVREIKNENSPMLHSDGEQKRDYIHVDDVVRLIDICLAKKPDDTFNVCTGSLISVNQIVNYVLDVFDSNIQPQYRDASKLWDTYPELFDEPYSLNKDIVAKETNKYSRGSYQKAKEILGWEPNTNLEELFKKVVSEIKI
jgi:nucleoside-diphosphate-sugar epimerase